MIMPKLLNKGFARFVFVVTSQNVAVVFGDIVL